MPRPSIVPVLIEWGQRRTFATALTWPGWARSGRDEDDALAALDAYRSRFAPVAADAALRFPAAVRFDVSVRVRGGGAIDFGVPEAIVDADEEPLTRAQAARGVALLHACWRALDAAAAAAPPVLRKGPRGGGRDRDAVVAHVAEAEAAYARRIGLRLPSGPPDDTARRDALAELLGRPSDGTPLRERGWPARYAVRRIAWHALDHAWEIEDRREP